MKYISTKSSDEIVSFKEAVMNGMSANNGLYIPESIPQLPTHFFEHICNLTAHQIAHEVLYPFVENELSKAELQSIIQDTLNFLIPLVPIKDNQFALELFHGPTAAFKDVGARFMSRCFSHFNAKNKKNTTVLVATSGDTGAAVANGFFNIPGVTVKILFPKGKISPYQEFQMTHLGKNITAIPVEGTFDDCQNLVKLAFKDQELKANVSLSSANSINIARLLPQMLFYFLAYQQIRKHNRYSKIVVSVPSGNLGNLTSGLLAKKMGLPIDRFIAAHNANDTFHQYLKTGNFLPSASVMTYSNAMDVGNPSNFERLEAIFKTNINEVRNQIRSFSFDNQSTLNEIKNCFENTNYLLDPHGAVGKLALTADLKKDEVGIFLHTAHPKKFAGIVKKVIPNYTTERVVLQNDNTFTIKNSFTALKKILTT